MTSLTGMAVVNYLAATGPATQNMLSDALGVSQSNLSRILRNTPGIIKNDSVVPAIYSFDPGAIVVNVATNENSVTPNDTGVIRPDGSIVIGDTARYAPIHDTLADNTLEEVDAKLSKVIETLRSHKGLIPLSANKNAIVSLANTFDRLVITLQSRLAKGDFDGNSTGA